MITYPALWLPMVCEHRRKSWCRNTLLHVLENTPRESKYTRLLSPDLILTKARIKTIWLLFLFPTKYRAVIICNFYNFIVIECRWHFRKLHRTEFILHCHKQLSSYLWFCHWPVKMSSWACIWKRLIYTLLLHSLHRRVTLALTGCFSFLIYKKDTIIFTPHPWLFLILLKCSATLFQLASSSGFCSTALTFFSWVMNHSLLPSVTPVLLLDLYCELSLGYNHWLSTPLYCFLWKGSYISFVHIVSLSKWPLILSSTSPTQGSWTYGVALPWSCNLPFNPIFVTTLTCSPILSHSGKWGNFSRPLELKFRRNVCLCFHCPSIPK